MDRKKLLLDIVCTSKNVSGYSDRNPSLCNAAILYASIEGIDDEVKHKVKQEFDGADGATIADPEFEEKKKKLEQVIEKIEQEVYGEIPVDKGYKKYETSLAKIKDEDLWEYGRALSRYSYGEEKDHVVLMDFPDESLVGLIESLIKLSRVKLKLNIYNHIEEEILLYGVYQYYDRFDSVPDACRFFKRQLGENYTRDLLKENIKNYARIYEEGYILDDWSKINKRINSWMHHEEHKYQN